MSVSWLRVRSTAAGILARLLGRSPAFVMAAGTAVLAACVATPARPSAAPPPAVTVAAPLTIAPGVNPIPRLELLDVLIMPRGDVTASRDQLFGSVSGLVRDARSGRYLAVIDDRLPARVAWLDIRHQTGTMTVQIDAVAPIAAAAGIDRGAVTGADLESVVAMPDGTFVATEEGHNPRTEDGQRGGSFPAALLTLSPAMVVTAVDPWPAMFNVGRENGGIRDNQGAESLARTPDGRLIGGLEQPRYADSPDGAPRNGRPFNEGRGGPGRLVEFVNERGHWQARRQWLYPIAPTETRAGFDAICDDGENGLAELLALDDLRLLALERACLQNTSTKAARNTAHLYLVDLAGADDVSGVPTLQGVQVRGVTKTLLLDFDTLIPKLPAPVASLDNFEALAFGPPLADGSRTLLVMSDDNFRPTQKNVLLLLAIK